MSRFVVRDRFFERAKREGYRARSAYKLKEIQERYHLVQKGDKVLDLGCSPGSFLQVLSVIVGEKGRVMGVDLLPTAPIPEKNIVTFVADIRRMDMEAFCAENGAGALDVITSDVAPNLSGIREADERNIDDLYQAIKKVASMGLRRGGHLVIKSFFSQDLKGIVEDLKGLFSRVSLFKPAASRSRSSEIYIVCTGKRHEPAPVCSRKGEEGDGRLGRH